MYNILSYGGSSSLNDKGLKGMRIYREHKELLEKRIVENKEREEKGKK